MTAKLLEFVLYSQFSSKKKYAEGEERKDKQTNKKKKLQYT